MTTGSASSGATMGLINANDVVLFQGDSITDCERRRSVGSANDPDGLGWGYAALAATQLLAERPEAGLRFYNRGVSGDKVTQLVQRWQTDCLDLAPNVLSILVGVNDMWHGMQGGQADTVAAFEQVYRRLLEQTRAALPEVKLVICEAFVLRCGVVDESWFPEFDERRAVTRRLARVFGATFVPFQAAFDDAVAEAPPEDWAADGVHPSIAGHRRMAATWLKAVAAGGA